MKLLIVEDEKELRDSISTYLTAEGHICESVSDCFNAEDKISAFEYDIVVLDLTLPDGNGLEFLKLVKSTQAQTAVLIVSAKNSLDDKVKGLDLGADDYLTKPFYLAELNSRINAVIRRRNFLGSSTVSFNEINIDVDARRVCVHDKEVTLTKKEYMLLLFLIMNKCKVITKESIAEHLWGDYTDLADNHDFIYTHIKNLRKKIENAGGGDYLKTVYGMGYKYCDL